MSTQRDVFIHFQAKILGAYFSLVPEEKDARVRFERLALDTHDCLVGKAHAGAFVPWPSAANFADYDRDAGDAAPQNLRQRWRDWKIEFGQLLERQPVLELREALREISESHESSSWLQGMGDATRDWVDAGDRSKTPFWDRRGVTTPEFYERLRQLRKIVGGWLYSDDRSDRIIFATDDERRRIGAGLR